MNAPARLRLDPGHWITIGTVLISSVASGAVMSWRISALEERVKVLDDRLWDHMRPPERQAVLPWHFRCPADASGYPLRTVALDGRP